MREQTSKQQEKNEALKPFRVNKVGKAENLRISVPTLDTLMTSKPIAAALG
jgi:hypothetical protein